MKKGVHTEVIVLKCMYIDDDTAYHVVVFYAVSAIRPNKRCIFFCQFQNVSLICTPAIALF